jgi:hypothetical protein
VLAAAGALWIGRSRCFTAPAARALIITLVGFGISNFVFLITTISLADFDLSLDSRTLLPCVPASVVLAVLSGHFVSTPTWPRRLAALLAFLFLVGLNAHRSGSLVASYSVLGKYHLNISTAQSTLPDFVHAHPDATFITNDPPYFFNLTRTMCLQVPAEYSILTNRRDPDFEAKVAALRTRLRSRKPDYLVVFDVMDVKTRWPAQRLMDGDRFERVLNDYFVSIYRFAPPRSAGAK